MLRKTNSPYYLVHVSTCRQLSNSVILKRSAYNRITVYESLHNNTHLFFFKMRGEGWIPVRLLCVSMGFVRRELKIVKMKINLLIFGSVKETPKKTDKHTDIFHNK